ncbi:MAG TPA: response regulator transcription factor, partial [Chloroflexota bacterium]
MVRILLADDHSVVLRRLRGLIEAQTSWTVCGEAATGPDTISRTAELQPDVVILDPGIPELNGIDATKKIRHLSPRTRVLIYSTHSSDHLARAAIMAGANGFLVKSDGVEQLIPSIEALLERRLVLTSPVFNGSATTDIYASG